MKRALLALLLVLAGSASAQTSFQAPSSTNRVPATVPVIPPASYQALRYAATSPTANTPLAFIQPGDVGLGCVLQNGGTVPIVIDWAGGTPSAPIFPQVIPPGVSSVCLARPNAPVNVWSPTGTSVPVYGGIWG